ncbi:L,D-transpeptidase [Microbaculum sp. FT89]|uniref:L,D-transpeptidase n=1 Tax=Microbaculum sp. FT89 TaxID=3447298 RepID=UPI003F52D457
MKWRFLSLLGIVASLVIGPVGGAQAEIDPLTGKRLQSGGVWAYTPIPRKVVSYDKKYSPGTIVVDTPERRLYLVLDDGKAIRYGIGVGREGFQFSGTYNLSRKAEWPDWRPPADMRARQPYLPTFMPGGPSNPLGARALYVGSTLYRIHGTNQNWSIGRDFSSGCIRMLNEDVIDLYNRVNIGARIVVLQ